MTLASEFLNDWQEVHAFWFGFSDAISWTRAPGEHPESLAEPHYYRFGYLTGGLIEAGFWFFFGALVTKMTFAVI